MNTEIYNAKKTYNRYDDEHFLLYINEVIVDNYVPSDADRETLPITAYQYTGNFLDGGTLIEAKNDTYEDFVSGLVRSRYSADQVEAIILNLQSNNVERQAEFQKEMDDLNAFRTECKQIVDQLLR